ncbi:Crp/Fnr family transcriptional regulator [bacterium]|nr:Crp/Fnr family transcriptional regulator [bacterium]
MSEMISQEMEVSPEEATFLDACIPIKNFKKGDILLREGQVANNCYFTIQGCVRQYYLSDGDEHTTAFFIEEQSIASMTSYLNRTPASHFLECVEDCTLAVLNFDKEKELYDRYPKYESLCRMSMEEDFGKQQERMAKFITSSPEKRYLDLLEYQPGLMNRVPQYVLASYLGVKPESLSRIRKRVAQKG